MKNFDYLSKPKTISRVHLKQLLCLGVSLPVLMMAVPVNAQDANYFNADGSKTGDLSAAKTTWQNDTEFNGNWGLKAINADGAYALGFTGKGSRLGVIDQPVWTGHPEFLQNVDGKGKLTFLTTTGTYVYDDPYVDREPGEAFTYDGQIYVDGYEEVASHGTHVGGIAAANRDTIAGKPGVMQGVAYNAQIFAADNGDPGPEDGVVLGNDGGAYSAAWQAMIDSDVDVITNSWGIGVSGATWEYAQAAGQYKEIEAILGTPQGGAYDGVLKAARNDIIIEFSAGNDYGLEPDAMAGLPAFVSDVEKNWIATMSVAEVKDDDGEVIPGEFEKSGFSSICGYTKYFCVAAPGSAINSSVVTGDITGKVPGDVLTELEADYDKYSGTSMAGPFVSGSIAVLKERFPYLSNGELANILKTTSTDMGDEGVDSVYGWGLINLDKAMHGPGQLLGHMEAELSADQFDTWSNDISDVALQQRQSEEQSEVANWAEMQEALKAEVQPVPDLVNPSVDLISGMKQARAMLKAAIDVNYTDTYVPDDFEAAIEALEADPYGNQLLAFYEAANPGWQANYSTRSDYADFIDGRNDTELAGDVANIERDAVIAANELVDVKIEGGQYRVDQLSKKTDADYASSLTKSGAGTLQLTGVNTYRGDTVVNGGLLRVDGSLASTAIAAAGGTLGGNGVVGRLEARKGGTIAPGASIGTLSVTRDAVFDMGSIYRVEVAEDGRSDLLVVGGEAQLNGGQVLITGETAASTVGTLASAAKNKTQYDILTAGSGVKGTFTDAATPYVFFDPKLSYGANGVTAQIERLAFASLGTTFNEKETAAGVDSLEPGSVPYDTLLAATDPEKVAPYLASLTGEIHATQQGALIEGDAVARDAAIGRVRMAFAAPLLEQGSAAEPITDPASWAQVHGSWIDTESDGNAQSVDRRQGGVLAGVDGMVNDTWTAGVLVGYSDGAVDAQTANSDVESLQLGVYGGARWDQVGLRLGASLARHSVETSRYVQGLTAEADYDGSSFQTFAETGCEIERNGTVYEPYAGLTHTRLKLDGFTESGAGDFNLTGDDMSTNVTTSSLGIRFGHAFQMGAQTGRLTGGIAWEHVFGDTDTDTRLAFAGGDGFTNKGLPIADDVLAVEVGVDVNMSETATLGISYKGQFADDITDNALNANLSIRF